MGICAYDIPTFNKLSTEKTITSSEPQETKSPSLVERASKFDFSDIPLSLKELFTSNPTIPLPKIEKDIRERERNCIFAKKTISKAFKNISKEGINKKLSLMQFKRALYELGINPKILEDPDDSMWLFLFSFQENSLFDMRKIISSFILISDSELKKKIKFLYLLYDENENRVLEPNEVRSMLSDLAEVSIECLPLLAQKPENSEELSKYMEFMRIEKERLIEEASKTLLGNSTEVGNVELLNILQNSNDWFKIFRSEGLRETILEKYKLPENPQYLEQFLT